MCVLWTHFLERLTMQELLKAQNSMFAVIFFHDQLVVAPGVQSVKEILGRGAYTHELIILSGNQ